MPVIEIVVLSVAFVFFYWSFRNWAFEKYVRRNLGWLYRPKVGHKHLDIDETYDRFNRSNLLNWNFRSMERYEANH